MELKRTNQNGDPMFPNSHIPIAGDRVSTWQGYSGVVVSRIFGRDRKPLVVRLDRGSSIGYYHFDQVQKEFEVGDQVTWKAIHLYRGEITSLIDGSAVIRHASGEILVKIDLHLRQVRRGGFRRADQTPDRELYRKTKGRHLTADEYRSYRHGEMPGWADC